MPHSVRYKKTHLQQTDNTGLQRDQWRKGSQAIHWWNHSTESSNWMKNIGKVHSALTFTLTPIPSLSREVHKLRVVLQTDKKDTFGKGFSLSRVFWSSNMKAYGSVSRM